MKKTRLLQEFRKYGRMLFEQGLNNSHSGNMSVRQGEFIYITGHGAKLCSLESSDIVRVNLHNDRKDKNASVEIGVHRAIYLQCPGTGAVAHAHVPYGTVLSLKNVSLVPVDSEGAYYFNRIPVLSCKETIASCDVAAQLPPLIAKHKAALVRAHGAFAGGKDLEEATLYLSVLESVSRLLFLSRQMK